MHRVRTKLDAAVISREIDGEYARLVTRPSVRRLLLRSGTAPQEFINRVADIRLAAERVAPTGEPPPCRDERDRIYLHCAVVAKVDYLITADLDLLELGKIEGTPILTPAAYLETVGPG